MLPKLTFFELNFHLKKTSYILFTALFFLFGIYLGIQEGAIRPENKYNLHLFIGLISLAIVFQLVFQTSYTILRDRTYRTTQLIHTTSISKFYFLLSRFLGIFFTCTLSSFLYIFGLFASVLIDPFAMFESNTITFWDFLWPWLIIVVPNVFILSGLLFSAALFTKKTSLVFFMGILIFALFWMNNFYIGSPFTGGKLVASQKAMNQAAVMDVFGLCASYEQTQFWSPIQKQEQHVTLSGNVWVNRLLWSSVSMGLLLLVYLSFSFRINQQGKRSWFKRRFLKKKRKDLSYTEVGTYQHAFTIKHTFSAKLKEFSTLVWIDLKTTVFSKAFVLLVLVWTAMLVAAILHNLSGQDVYGHVLPTTGLLTGIILEPLSQMGLFLIVFYAGELIWNSRQHQFHEILDTTPALNEMLLSSKYVALFLLPIIIATLGIIIALLFQFTLGYKEIQWSLYVSIFYYGGASLFIYGVLSIFTQLWVSNKYVGMILSLLVIYGLGFTLPALGVQHPLGKLFNLPMIGEGYSEFIGFGQKAHQFLWMSFVWIPISLIVLMMSFKMFKRNSEYRLLDPFQAIFKGWKISQRMVVLSLIVFICISTTVIDSKSKMTTFIGYETETQFREQYEKRYAKYATKPVPVFKGISTQVKLFPKQQSYQVAGTYTLVNNTNKFIDTVFITSPLKLEHFSIQGAQVIEQDTSFVETRLLVFDPKLGPNDERMMEFSVEKSAGDFEMQRDILYNGTYLRNSSFEPRFGYQQVFELSSSAVRRKRGLSPEKIVRESLESFTRPKQDFETWVTTDKDQIAIAPGKLLDTIHQGDRVSYHYKSYGKTDNNLSYFSSEYAITKTMHRGISLEVYHLPQHNTNIVEILKAAKATLDYCSENFGQYPYDHLRIAEVPLHWKFGGHALSGTIAFQERFFTQDMTHPKKGIDQLSRVIIHEISHQWFGHKLSPAPRKGANLLTESMANYVEAQVLQTLYGTTIVRRLANFSRRRYFNFRSLSEGNEVPLSLVKNEPYIAYRKGFVSMQALKELFGEYTLNSCLKQLIDEHTMEQSAKASDLLDILYARSDADKKTLIEDWFESVLYYDLAFENIVVKPLKNGKTRIEVEVHADRVKTLEDGSEIYIGLNELISIGFYDKHPNDIYASPIVKKFTINSKKSHLVATLDSSPKYITLDPFFTRLDKDISDQFYEVNIQK